MYYFGLVNKETLWIVYLNFISIVHESVRKTSVPQRENASIQSGLESRLNYLRFYGHEALCCPLWLMVTLHLDRLASGTVLPWLCSVWQGACHHSPHRLRLICSYNITVNYENIILDNCSRISDHSNLNTDHSNLIKKKISFLQQSLTWKAYFGDKIHSMQ